MASVGWKDHDEKANPTFLFWMTLKQQQSMVYDYRKLYCAKQIVALRFTKGRKIVHSEY